MQVIDSHCHFWALARGEYDWLMQGGPGLDAIRRDFHPSDYPCAAAEVQGLIAVQAEASLADTEWLLELAAQYPRIRGVIGWVDLGAENACAQIAHFQRNPVFRGLRPMLQDIAQTDWLLEAPRPEALTSMLDYGLSFDALVTTRHLPVLRRFAAQNPDLPIVIDHAAKPQPSELCDWRAGMRALGRETALHCKLSGLMTELADPTDICGVFSQLIDWFGPGRLIWGSDWPVLTLAAGYDEWRALVARLLTALSPAEREAIMGGNACRFYGVKP